MKRNPGNAITPMLMSWFQSLPIGGKIVVGGLGGLSAAVLIGAKELGIPLTDLVGYAPALGVAAGVSAGAGLGGWFWWQQRQRAQQDAQNVELAKTGRTCLILPPRGDAQPWKAMASQAQTFAGHVATALRQFPDSHVALEIVGSQAGTVFQVWAPEKLYPILEQLLLASFPEAQLRQPHTLLDRPDALADLAKNTAWSRLKLERNPANPLKTAGEFPDDALASLMATLARTPGMGRIGIQLILKAPNRKWNQAGWQEARKLRQQSSEIPAGQRSESFRKRLEALERKLEALTTVSANVVIFAEPRSMARLPQLRMALTNSVESAHNYLKEAAQGQGPEILQGRHFDPRTGQNTVFSADELASLWHVSRAGDAITARGVYLAPPPEVVTLKRPPFDPRFRVLGECLMKTGEKGFARWPHGFDTLVHSFWCGPTGIGKSTLLAFQIVQDLCAGYGAILMEPHRDLTLSVIDAVPQDRLGDVIWINPTGKDRSFGVNLLDYGGDPNRREIVSADFNAVLKKMLGNDYEGIRMGRLLRNAIHALVEAEAKPTMLHLLAFLQSADYRETALAAVENPIIRAFWEDEFTQWSASVQSTSLGPVLNRVEPLLTRMMTRHVVAQSTTTLPLRQLMDAGKIILIDLSAKDKRIGDDNAKALGTLMIALVWAAASSRVKGTYPLPTYFWVDEFQEYVAEDFVNILAEARGFGLGLNLATQYYGRLPEWMRQAVLSNCRTKLAGAIESPDEARLMERIFSVPESQIRSLDAYTYLTRVSVNRRASDTFTLIGLPPLGKKADQINPALLREAFTRAHRGQPPMPSDHGAIPFDFFAGIAPLDPTERTQWTRHQTTLRSLDLAARAKYLAALPEAEWESYRRLRRQADLEEYQNLLAHPHLVPDLPDFELLSEADRKQAKPLPPQARRIRRLSSLQAEVPRDEIEAERLRIRSGSEGTSTSSRSAAQSLDDFLR